MHSVCSMLETMCQLPVLAECDAGSCIAVGFTRPVKDEECFITVSDGAE